MSDNQIIHGLWVGNHLSPIELLTLHSFKAHGHRFLLWAYEPIDNVIEGVEVMDANAIIPASEVFTYKNKMKEGHGKGSYAGFSDLFRYKLLNLRGGIYVDMDITCLKPFDFTDEYVFRYHHKYGCVGNILKAPKGSEVMDWCHNQALGKVNADNTDWSLPIRILHNGMKKYKLTDQILEISNLDSWPLVAQLLSGPAEVPENWYAIHWMNEEWRRLGLKKNRVVEGSKLHEIISQYPIEVELLRGLKLRFNRWKLSRLNYMIINGLARLGL